jgi:hypothetical protein
MSILNFRENTVPALSISAGADDEVSYIHQFGFTDGIGSADTPVSIHSSRTLYPFLTSASQLTLASTLGDTNNVTVYGLDANYDMIDEVVTLNGVTGVLTSQSFLRVHSIVCDTTNTGAITAKVGSSILAEIRPNQLKSLMAVYTVPRGYTAFMMGVDVSVNKGHDAIVNMYARASGDFKIQFTSDVYQSAYSYRPAIPIRLPQTTDIDFRISDVENSNTRVACGFELVLDKCLNY